jgi:hypothetical protein
MKKFVVLYRVPEGSPSTAEMMANSTPEQMKAGMAIWQAWQDKADSAILDVGAPLDHLHTVTAKGSAEGKSTITGYTLLQAASMEEAIRLMEGHPHFHVPNASIEILESVPMPGM